jgi:sulfonate transport system substrate-binding protein
VKSRFQSLRAAALLLVAGLALQTLSARADEAWPKQFTIGYQKFGTLIILKSRGDLDKRLAEHGVSVKWAEFPNGVPILEGMNGGSVDFAITGETPPLFGQAASGALIRYIAYEPAAPQGEAILVPKDSPIKSVADLKGKRIAVAQGSNSYYLLVQALKKAGLGLQDVNISLLKPADANAAFVAGDVDAWSIWDYYYAAAQAQSGARVLANGEGLIDNHAFFLASQAEIDQYPQVLRIALEEVAKVDQWAKDHPAEAAAQLSRQVGIDPGILQTAIQRSGFGPRPLDAGVIEAQQRMADTLYALHALPNAIAIKDAVVALPQWNGADGKLAAAR